MNTRLRHYGSLELFMICLVEFLARPASSALLDSDEQNPVISLKTTQEHFDRYQQPRGPSSRQPIVYHVDLSEMPRPA